MALAVDPPLVLSHLRLAAQRRRRSGGFTLLEMMVVVIMVGLLVALSIPSITDQMKSRRTNQAANEVALLYRQARVRAMGRGSAVLVRYMPGPAGVGRVEVREAISGAVNTNCAPLPQTSCQLTDWSASSKGNQLIAQFDPQNLGVYENIELVFQEAANTYTTADVCFSPLGRPYIRPADTGVFAVLTDVPVVNVQRTDGVSFPRQVLVLPNGASRLSL